jgi:hypothetical protein
MCLQWYLLLPTALRGLLSGCYLGVAFIGNHNKQRDSPPGEADYEVEL